MPRLKPDAVPSYRLHKPTGQGVVTLDGRALYLGKHGTAASRRAYDRVTAEWLANGRRLPDRTADLTVTELVDAFWVHAQTYYRRPDGTTAGELENYRLVLNKNRPLRRLYGNTPAAEFGPLKLQAVRAAMIEEGGARTYVNRGVGRIKAVFQWASSQELIPPAVSHGLASVSGIRKGRGGVRDTKPVRPVSDAAVDAAARHLTPQLRAMVELQQLTGMRSGEMLIMRGRDVEAGDGVWIYRPESHKTEHHGIRREVLLGPRAWKVLQPWLKPDLAAYIFSPADSETARLTALRNRRKTRVQPTQVRRSQAAKRRRRARPPRDRYDTDSYRRAIARACEAAFGMPAELKAQRTDSAELVAEKRKLRRAWRDANVWHPHQIRHTTATRIRRRFGLEAARVILGHQSTPMTELYAEADVAKATRIMAEVG